MAIIKVITPSVTDANITTAKVTDNAITLAKMASGTDGNIISYDASGNPVAIATGNNGQILTSTGAGSPPAFETAAAGGKVLQVIQGTATSTVTSSANTFIDTGLSAAITPSASNSKVLVLVAHGDVDKRSSDTSMGINLLRGSTDIYVLGNALNNTGSSIEQRCSASGVFLDSPNTTSATTYKTQFKSASGSADVRVGNGSTMTITLMEIGA